MECIICASTKKKSLVKCEYCDFEACLKCTKTYILSQNVPGCMNNKCTGEWSRKFIRNNFSLSFIQTDLQKHKKEILFQSQLALMPETQLIIEEENRQLKLKKELIEIDFRIFEAYNSIEKDVAAIFVDYNRMCSFKVCSSYISRKIKREFNGRERSHTLFLNKQLKAMTPTTADIDKSYNDAMKAKKQLINDTIKEKVDILQQRREEVYYSIARKTREKSNFIMKCGNPDCNGFLNNHWNCGLCETKTCKDCHFVGEHESCDPDTVATVKLLKSDTKPCPKCHSNIFKIDGCDQMWCTQCKTAFSWRTGLIETKIHNPHYYEWRRQNGTLEREPGDVVHCDELNHNYGYFIDHMQVPRETINWLDRIVARCLHFRAMHTAPRQTEDDFLGCRLQYLKNKIDTNEFKTNILRIQKAKCLQIELCNIYALLVTTISEILFRFRQKSLTTNPNQYDSNILSEIPNIISYVNECFYEIAHTYNCKSHTVLDHRLEETRKVT